MRVVTLARIAASPALRESALSMFDQGVCSLSNFLTGVIVARALVPEEFGIYSLYFAGVMVLSGFQNALITGPARVLGVRPTGVDAGAYFSTQVQLQVVLSAILISGSALGLFTLLPGDTFRTFAFLLCLLLVQLQELARVIYLTRIKLPALLRLDLATHGLRISLLVAAVGLDVLSAGTALLVIAAACGFGLIIAGRRACPKKTTGPLRETAAANWRFGRWLLLETIAYSASTQIYLYLTALWIDTAAVGGLSAALVLVSAVNVFVLGVMNYAVPVARQRLLESGYEAWRRWLFRIGLFLTAGVGSFLLIASLFAEPLLSLVYGPAYVRFANLIPVLALCLFLSAGNTVFLAAFRTAEMPQVGFVAKTASALVTLGLAYPLLTLWDVTGAALGLVLTQALWAAIYAAYAARGTLAEARARVAVEGRHDE